MRDMYDIIGCRGEHIVSGDAVQVKIGFCADIRVDGTHLSMWNERSERRKHKFRR